MKIKCAWGGVRGDESLFSDYNIYVFCVLGQGMEILNVEFLDFGCMDARCSDAADLEKGEKNIFRL